MSDPVITDARFERDSWGPTRIDARMDEGTIWEPVCEYYSDEISFSLAEVMGKTKAQVTRMHFEKDKAYLQS
jgi:hypothetical protein